MSKIYNSQDSSLICCESEKVENLLNLGSWLPVTQLMADVMADVSNLDVFPGFPGM